MINFNVEIGIKKVIVKFVITDMFYWMENVPNHQIISNAQIINI